MIILICMMVKNLKKFEQNIGVVVNNSNDSKSKLNFHFSFKQIANILGFLTTISSKVNKQEIIEILIVIANS